MMATAPPPGESAVTPTPTGGQFIEVLETIERLNIEAEALVVALARAKEYMTSEMEGPSHDPH